MDSDRLNRWLQLIASFGLLVGVRVYFSNPFAKRWWQIERDSDYYSADFRRSMDAAVSDLSQDFGRRLLEGLESEAAGP